jgi:hypothetical protein
MADAVRREAAREVRVSDESGREQQEDVPRQAGIIPGVKSGAVPSDTSVTERVAPMFVTLVRVIGRGSDG